jgi:hypothetical protein
MVTCTMLRAKKSKETPSMTLEINKGMLKGDETNVLKLLEKVLICESLYYRLSSPAMAATFFSVWIGNACSSMMCAHGA